jgi:hypothetical protein
MNGRLVLEEHSSKVVLRMRYAPFWTALWCYGIMAAVAHFVTNHSDDTEFNNAFIFGGPILASVFVVIAFYLESRPPLLLFDQAEGCLHIPRLEAVVPASTQQPIGFGDVTILRSHSRETGQVLYVTWTTPQKSIPIFVHHAPLQMETRVRQFASKIGKRPFERPSTTVEL